MSKLNPNAYEFVPRYAAWGLRLWLTMDFRNGLYLDSVGNMLMLHLQFPRSDGRHHSGPSAD